MPNPSRMPVGSTGPDPLLSGDLGARAHRVIGSMLRTLLVVLPVVFPATFLSSSRIEAGAGRMGELIDDVIEYSSATRRTPVMTSVDLDRLVRSIIARISQAYPATRFKVEPLGELAGDARMLEEILGHLLGNALKFSAQAAHPPASAPGSRSGWASPQGTVPRIEGLSRPCSRLCVSAGQCIIGPIATPLARRHGLFAPEPPGKRHSRRGAP